MNTAQLIVAGDDASATLHIAVAAYLARFKGQSRVHTESDLRCFINLCRRQGLDPLAAQRPHVELFLR
jgi:integrase/recombinase XerD